MFSFTFSTYLNSIIILNFVWNLAFFILHLFICFLSQIIAAIGCTTTTIAVGMVIGYSAILLPELQLPNSRIHVDLEIASWIGKREKS